MGNVLSKTTIDYISKPLFVDEPELGFGGRLNMGVGFMFSRSKKVTSIDILMDNVCLE